MEAGPCREGQVRGGEGSEAGEGGEGRVRPVQSWGEGEREGLQRLLLESDGGEVRSVLIYDPDQITLAGPFHRDGSAVESFALDDARTVASASLLLCLRCFSASPSSALCPSISALRHLLVPLHPRASLSLLFPSALPPLVDCVVSYSALEQPQSSPAVSQPPRSLLVSRPQH